MELLTLKTFIAVVEEGGILAASRKLNTVQSNVTTRIKRLEEELGSALFHRQGRGLELSPAGRVLQEYAERMLQLETQAGNAMRMVGQSEGALRIGSMETFAAVRLPPALKQVRMLHPNLELSVQANTSRELLEKVLSFKLDCAFVGGPVDHPDLRSEEILVEELVLVRSKQHPGAMKTLILFREGCAYRARAQNWWREQGQQIGDIMELGTLEGILGCVAVGLGCTLMPRAVALMSRYADELIIESVPAHLAKIPTLMVSHRDTPPLACLQTLAQAVTHSAAEAA
ncbi:MAG: LysR family transcriptional regulator [Motiliproteus sp.]|nr:LysR family transcriptional regulator [Motiliproteus sp.]MCW9051931.1 LysR family transcriptional regulator [Motiliproteus sp.]